jgi:DnaJ-class molecular chaperone
MKTYLHHRCFFGIIIRKLRKQRWMLMHENKPCAYCSGNGYVYVVLGGSETCYGCGGTGIEQQKVEAITK